MAVLLGDTLTPLGGFLICRTTLVLPFTPVLGNGVQRERCIAHCSVYLLSHHLSCSWVSNSGTQAPRTETFPDVNSHKCMLMFYYNASALRNHLPVLSILGPDPLSPVSITEPSGPATFPLGHSLPSPTSAQLVTAVGAWQLLHPHSNGSQL